MNRTVERGRTLLVDGPASVTMLSGKAEVFGHRLGTGSKIVIREGKKLPFAVDEKAVFDLSLAEKASAEEVEGNTIPPSWAKSYGELESIQTRPVTAIVLGEVDSGKTSFCTYLINRLLTQKKKTVILDGDIGQSDVGPPCTVAYATMIRPTTDLFNLQAKNAVFIGVNSPIGFTDKVIDGLKALKKEILESNIDFVVVNTDGWIAGEEATQYKLRLVEEINPDLVLCVQKKDELANLLEALTNHRKITVESPNVISERTKERRKNLRELGYLRYLKNAKVQSFPLGWLKVEDSELLGLAKTRIGLKEARRVYDFLGMKPLHLAEQSGKISIIIGKRRWINTDSLKRIEEATRKKVVLIRKGEEEGLLIALYNAHRRFLGIGILQEIDYLRKNVRILTPVSKDIAIASIGKVKIDKNMKELPAFDKEDQSIPPT